MLDWLRLQWANDVQPRRSQLMEQFVVDSFTVERWKRRKGQQLQDQLQKEGMAWVDAWSESISQVNEHPDIPKLTPRPIAEAYRRALRTLVDRQLVNVVADPDNYYRYTDPQADNPLRVVMNQGRYNESIGTAAECDRPRGKI